MLKMKILLVDIETVFKFQESNWKLCDLSYDLEFMNLHWQFSHRSLNRKSARETVAKIIEKKGIKVKGSKKQNKTGVPRQHIRTF